METLIDHLSKKVKVRSQFYNKRIKELHLTELEFAKDVNLQKQLTDEFNTIWNKDNNLEV